jgi:hypothetical protein
MVYDAADGYIVAYLFCLYPDVVFASCTWKYSGGTWTNLTAAQSANPPAVLDGSFVWDASDHCAVLFGGDIYPIGRPFTSVWEFQDGKWSNLSTPAPPMNRSTFSVRAAYDGLDGYVVSVWQNFERPSGSTYTWTFGRGSWTNLTSTSNGTDVPLDPMAATEPGGDALFFGGTNGTTLAPSNETWRFSGGEWHHLSTRSAPSPRFLASFADDSLDGYDLLVGGYSGNCPGATCELHSDEWVFDAGEWTNITATLHGDPPLEQGGLMADDLADGYVLEGFGSVPPASESGAYVPQADLYAYSNGTWTAFAPSSAGGFPWVDTTSLSVVGVAAAAAVGALLLRQRRRRRPGVAAHPPAPADTAPVHP